MNAAADDLLDQLAAAGVVNRLLRFTDDSAAALSLDEEGVVLEALAAVAEGPIYRLGPFRCAFACAVSAEAALADLRAALPDFPGLGDAALVEVAAAAAVTHAAASSPPAAPLVLGALAGAALSLPGAARVVVDAPPAAAALAAVEARLAAAAAGPDPERLGRLEAAIAALGDRVDAPAADESVPEAVRALGAALDDRLARIEMRLDAPSSADGQAAPAGGAALAERIGALESALTPSADGALVEAIEAQAARLTLIEERLAALAEDDGAAGRLAEIAAAVHGLADRPSANADYHEARQGMLRLASAMQSMLDRLDAATGRLVDGAEAGKHAIQSVLERIDALGGPGSGDAAADALSPELDRFEQDRSAETESGGAVSAERRSA